MAGTLWLLSEFSHPLMWPFKKSTKETASEETASQDSLRCAIANVLGETSSSGDDKEIGRGTKHFRGGAKVYLIDYYPGTCDTVVVVGHHRASGRYIELSMRVKHLENFRMTTVYSPRVLELIRRRYSSLGSQLTEDHAQHICDAARQWAEAER